MFGWFDSKAVDAFADTAVADLVVPPEKMHAKASAQRLKSTGDMIFTRVRPLAVAQRVPARAPGQPGEVGAEGSRVSARLRRRAHLRARHGDHDRGLSPDVTARRVFETRRERRAIPDAFPGYAQDPVALATDRRFKVGAARRALRRRPRSHRRALRHRQVRPAPVHGVRGARAPAAFQGGDALELGVGGYGRDLGGESLLMWAAYFRNGRIYGLDIEDKTALREAGSGVPARRSTKEASRRDRPSTSSSTTAAT